MTTFTPTYTFTVNTPIRENEVDQDFADVQAVLNGNVDDTNIAATAGIGVLKLAAPYSVDRIEWVSPPTATPVPNGSAPGTAVKKHRMRLPAGRPHAICAMDVWAGALALAGNTVSVTVQVGTTTLGGASVSVAAADTHYVVPTSGDPFATPLLTVSDGDEVVISWFSNAGAPTVTSLNVTITTKELHSA